MSQKQKIYKLFLIAVFYLMFFSAANSANAITITTSGDHVLIGGVPTFISSMYSICGTYGNMANCATKLGANPQFSFDIGADKSASDFSSGGQRAAYESAKKYVSYPYASNSWSAGNGLVDYIQTGGSPIMNDSYFFGYHVDEPEINNIIPLSDLLSYRTYIRSKDTNHPIIINLCCEGGGGLPYFGSAGDIFMYDRYSYGWWTTSNLGASLSDSLYGYEHLVKRDILVSYNDVDSDFSKPVLAFTQSPGADEGGELMPPNNWIRAQTYLSIAMGMDGVNFWQYSARPLGAGGPDTGLVINSSKNNYVQSLSAEIKSLQGIWLLPRTAYAWQYDQDYTSVSFSNNPSRTIIGQSRKALNYRLYKDGTTYYLLLVNKDPNAVSTAINIAALSGSGAMTAKTLGAIGTGSGVSGRTITVSNGIFPTENLEGYASVIYQIYSGPTAPPLPGGGVTPPPAPDTTPPAISITCPADGATYTSPVTTVSGTVTDAGGMGTVRVKVGTGGAWQNATVTGNSWVINNLTGIVAGLNTIYAQATDLAGNSSPELGESINVSYSTSLPPIVTYTSAEVMAAIQPYLIPANIASSSPMHSAYSSIRNVNIYKLPLPVNPAVFIYTSSASIDCDGQYDVRCFGDPTNLSQTSFTQTNGQPLKPADLPWYVLPETPNTFFDYANNNIAGGEAGLVIYNNNMSFGVFGDERGRDVGNSDGSEIGEISYAMCIALGLSASACNPDTGGIESGVTYLIFTTGANVVSPIENVAAGVTKGSSALNTMMCQLVGCSPARGTPPVCISSSNPITCPNGICDAGETMYTCPADCPYVPLPIICGDSTDKKCPDGCTYLEDIDCPLPPPPPDTVPPTIPQKLKATGSITVPAIDLVWRASTDDRGVAGYNIYRNGVLIATVNRTSYTDTNVVFGTTYAYTISAVDAAGNESAQSNQAAAMSAPLNVEFTKAGSASDFSQFIGNFLKWILTVAGSLAMLIIIIGGVMYISSTGNEQRVVLAKKIVLGAIGGLAVVLMAYSIVALIGRIV